MQFQLPESVGNDPAEADEDLVLISGYLKKQDSRYNSLWKERFFVMKGSRIDYYLKETDLEQHRATYVLRPSCLVSQVKTTSDKKQNPYYIFEVSWPKEDGDEDEVDDSRSVIDGAGGAGGGGGGGGAGGGGGGGGVGVKSSVKGGGAGSSPRGIIKQRSKKDVEIEKKEVKASKMSNIKVAALALGGVIAGTLTSGIGLLAGMTVIGMGAAAGGGAVALSSSTSGIEIYKQLVCANDSYEVAERWVQIIKAQIRELNDDIIDAKLHSSLPPTLQHKYNRNRMPPHEIQFKNIENWIQSVYWKVYSVRDGIRIFEHRPYLEENINHSDAYCSNHSSSNNNNSISSSNNSISSSNNSISSSTSENPCLRANISVNGSLFDVLMTIMSIEKESCKSGIIKAARLVENIDNNTDIIHLLLEPVYLDPVWSSPRDFCLMRYWKQNADGCYIVCLTSVTHHDCPIMTGYVRADLQASYIISPPLEDEFEEDQTESLITFVAQCNPKGWIWKNHGFQHKFLEIFMMHILDFRDSIDSDRFIQAQFDSFVENEAADSRVNEDSNDDVFVGDEQGRKIALIPAPQLPKEMWDNIDEGGFKVRGKNYLKDSVKIKSAPSLFKLIAVDLLKSSSPIYNVCSHPRNRVKLAHDRGEKFWCFAVNLMIPGKTNYNMVSYFLGDKSMFDENTPFAKVGKPFFFGNDDEYRNKRFKLIPRIVEGNFIVKNSVPEKPAVMGTKVKQLYHRDDHYFELAIDVGSSSVARHTTGLAQGFSTVLVVDMAFCLEGKEEVELPEVLMGGFRCVYVDMEAAKEM